MLAKVIVDRLIRFDVCRTSHYSLVYSLHCMWLSDLAVLF